MKTLLSGLMLALVFVLGMSPASVAAPAAQVNPAELPIEDLIATAERQHPAVLYVLAARLLADGKGQEAANWMYAAQLRYRFLVEATEDRDEDILFTALTEEVGRPVNEYIAGSVDEWIAATRWALDWDAAHENAVTSKADHAAALADIRSGLVEFAESLDRRREEIPRLRAQNGLENR